MRLIALLARTSALHRAWEEALHAALTVQTEELALREELTLDACALAREHGMALCLLLESELQATALATLRLQHEALLRAAWICFAASASAIQVLGAPLTPQTLKRANTQPFPNDLLKEVEKSDAPTQLKLGLREFREESWSGVNSYAHAGLLALGRVGTGHPESQLIQAVQASNAHGYAACMLAAGIIDPLRAPAHINVISVAHPDCMRRA